MNKMFSIVKSAGKHSKITVATNRITVKLSPDVIDFWEGTFREIADKLEKIQVLSTHRGRLYFTNVGFYSVVKSERKNSSIAIDYHTERDVLTWTFIL